MKRKIYLLIIFVTPMLLCMKCAQGQVNIIIKNDSDKDIFLSYTTNDSINKIMLKNIELYDCNIKSIAKKSILQTDCPESFLNFYTTKDGKKYIFYFFQIKENRILYEKKPDSIILSIDEINIGVDKQNIFIYENNTIRIQ